MYTALVRHRPKPWEKDAECKKLPFPRNVRVEIFHPEPKTASRKIPGKAYALAKLTCRGCPVRWDCLFDHLDEDYGCWGGATPNERDIIKRQLKVRSKSAVKAIMEEMEHVREVRALANGKSANDTSPATRRAFAQMRSSN